jgi:hypothetical protein
MLKTQTIVENRTRVMVARTKHDGIKNFRPSLLIKNITDASTDYRKLNFEFESRKINKHSSSNKELRLMTVKETQLSLC